MRSRPLLVSALALVLVVAFVGAPTAASTGTDADDPRRFGSVDLALEDEHVHVGDVEVSGDGLPTIEVEHRTYEIESATITTEGVTAAVGGTTYRIGEVTIGVENVGVTLENVSISGE